MRSHAKKITNTSMLVCVALLLSYLETLLPYIPLPGFKPGLANLAVIVAYFHLGLPFAATVSMTRIFLSSLLFGSPVSLFFSLTGGMLSLAALAAYRYLLKEYIGVIGLCVLSSALHCIGQSVAASILYGASLLFTYLPWILLLSIPTGILTGALSFTIVTKLKSVKHAPPAKGHLQK